MESNPLGGKKFEADVAQVPNDVRSLLEDHGCALPSEGIVQINISVAKTRESGINTSENAVAISEVINSGGETELKDSYEGVDFIDFAFCNVEENARTICRLCGISENDELSGVSLSPVWTQLRFKVEDGTVFHFKKGIDLYLSDATQKENVNDIGNFLRCQYRNLCNEEGWKSVNESDFNEETRRALRMLALCYNRDDELLVRRKNGFLRLRKQLRNGDLSDREKIINERSTIIEALKILANRSDPYKVADELMHSDISHGCCLGIRTIVDWDKMFATIGLDFGEDGKLRRKKKNK